MEGREFCEEESLQKSALERSGDFSDVGALLCCSE